MVKRTTPLTDDVVQNETMQEAADEAQATIPADVADELGLDLPSPADDTDIIMAHVRDALSAEAASAVGDAERWVGVETHSTRKADQGYNLDADVESPPTVGDSYRPLAVEGEDPPRTPKGAPPLSEAPQGEPDRSIYGDKPRWLGEQETHGTPYVRRMQVDKVAKAQRINKNSMLSALNRERDSQNARLENTAEVRISAPAQERINELNMLEEIVQYAPAEVTHAIRFGCGPHEHFVVYMPGQENIVFNHHIYETSDPLEIGALRRVVAQERIGEDDLVELDPGVEAYFHKDGTFLGWEKPNSVNVKRWEKQRVLRGF